MNASGHTLVKEMGLTSPDFFRALPLALGGRPFQRTESGVVCAEDDRRVEITLREQPPRRLGPTVRVPVLRVELQFYGYSPEQRDAFMTCFDRYFMRAGG